MDLVIAILAASIWLDVIQPGSVATRPKSPYVIVLPLVATPFILPLWTLRRFTLFGINTCHFLLSGLCPIQLQELLQVLQVLLPLQPELLLQEQPPSSGLS